MRQACADARCGTLRWTVGPACLRGLLLWARAGLAGGTWLAWRVSSAEVCMQHTENLLEPKDQVPFDLCRPRTYEVDEIDPALDEAEDWEDVAPPRTPRARRRQLAAKIVGVLAIAGAFCGIGEVATDANARHAMADWLTLGHGAEVSR